MQRRILGLKSRGFFKDQGGVGMTRAGYIKGELYYCFLYFYFFKDFIYFIFRERGKEGEREGEKHQCLVSSHASPNWGPNLTHNPSMCPDGELNQ